VSHIYQCMCYSTQHNLNCRPNNACFAIVSIFVGMNKTII
jgi:hypothetical protein